LVPTTASAATGYNPAFVDRLHQLGWVENHTVKIEYRWAEGSTERFADLASDLVRLKPDVIVTWGTETALAVKKAISTIPVVFTIVGDPVGSGRVESLAHPGGNVTGLSSQHVDTAGKRVQYIREIMPQLRHLGFLVNAGNPAGMLELNQAETAARTLEIEATAAEVRQAEDIQAATEGLKGKIEALYVVSDSLFNNNRTLITSFALSAHLPTVSGFRNFVAAGGLISYAADYPDLLRRTADHVDKILRGAKPAEIPLEQPTKFELVINVTTAKALELEIPRELLTLADELIQ
jgi:putative ABC transport system substrate-binding protein